MYEVEGQLKILLALIFNAIVLGMEIDGLLPLAYGTVFTTLIVLQYLVRKRVTEIYLDSQRWNNRVTAHGYTLWDNVFAGNRYNLRLWFAGFKDRARGCLQAAIRVIVAREGLSAAGAIFGLTIVFTTLAYIAFRDAGDTALLIGMAATLPRQIDMTNEVHQLAIDFNDVLAAWTRVGGIAENMRPEPDPNFNRRIKFDRLDAFAGLWLQASGEFTDADGKSRRIAVAFGPERGTVGQRLLRNQLGRKRVVEVGGAEPRLSLQRESPAAAAASARCGGRPARLRTGREACARGSPAG